MWRANSLEKSPDAGKDWRQEEKRMTENEMVWLHHQLNGHEFVQASGAGEGKPGVLQSMGWQRVWHDWLNNSRWVRSLLVPECWRTCLPVKETWFDPWVGKIHWRRKWQPIPAFLLENPRDIFAWWPIMPPALKALGLWSNPWTTREVPTILYIVPKRKIY